MSGSASAPSTTGEAAAEGEVAKAVQEELRACIPSATKCTVCAEAFKSGETALLSCCHTVCRACLGKLAQARQTAKMQLACPICAIPLVEKLEDVPMNSFVEAALAITSECAECREDDMVVVHSAVSTCADCSKPLCADHEKIHRNRNKTRSHVLTPLAEAVKRLQCQEHQSPLTHYCTNCAKVICGGCSVMGHAGPQHHPEELAHYIFPLQAALATANKAGAARQTEVVQRVTDVRTAVNAVALAKEVLRAEAKASFAAMEGLLRVRLARLLEDLDRYTAEETAELQVDKDTDLHRWLALQGGLDMAAKALATQATPIEKGQVAARTTSHLQAVAKDAVLPSPMPINISFQVDKGVDKYLQSVGSFFYSKAYGPACQVTGDGLSRAYTESTTRFTVTARTRRNEPVRDGGDRIDVRPVQGDSQIEIKVDVADKGKGVYDVSYSAPKDGLVALHVLLNGLAVTGSPFHVTVVNGGFFAYTNVTSCYDNCGILYYLATAKRTRAWQDPHTDGTVAVTASSIVTGSAADFVDSRDRPAASARSLFFGAKPTVVNDRKQLITSDSVNSWVSVDLKTGHVRPRGYVLSDGHTSSSNALRSWRLEGSVDGTMWTVLRTHDKDPTLTAPKVSAYWPIEMADLDAAFSKFRVYQTGPNQSGSNQLVCSGFEIYGELFYEQQDDHLNNADPSDDEESDEDM